MKTCKSKKKTKQNKIIKSKHIFITSLLAALNTILLPNMIAILGAGFLSISKY